MSLLSQIAQLLSQSPGNYAYHVIILLALQAALGLGLAHWRRDRSGLARRLAWGAAGLLLLRLGLLVVVTVLFSLNDATRPALVLPPLERAIDAATAVLFVWILAPQSRRLPRLGDTILLLGLIFTGIFYAFSAQDWQARVAGGLPYSATLQATLWTGYQLLILGAGCAFVLVKRERDWTLRLAALAAIAAAHLATIWSSLAPLAGELVYWVRLGYLVAFPLLAAFAFRANIAQLAGEPGAGRPSTRELVGWISRATDLVAAAPDATAVRRAVELVASTIPAEFIALALRNPAEPSYLRLTGNLPAAEDRPPDWGLKLADWPAFRLALEQRRAVELRPTGVGARQLHELARELGLHPPPALRVEPLMVGNQALGVMLLGRSPQQGGWRPEEQTLLPHLAGFVAQIIASGRELERAQVAAQGRTAGLPADQAAALAEERERTLNELATLQAHTQQLEAQLEQERQRARNLAATLAQVDRLTNDESIAALESEVQALREALIQAEEAMAMAAAGEHNLSTEWVTQTISRYSAELEEAEARIAALEQQLAEQDKAQISAVAISLIQELRTPLTSIGGYTELLLGEKMGGLETSQHDFLQRIQGNVERMRALLEQILQLALGSERLLAGTPVIVDVRQVIDTAINDIVNQVREKGLRLEIDVPPDLPPLTTNREALYQIVAHLLHNACLSSAADGRLAVAVRAQEMAINGQGNAVEFLELKVTDSGPGIHPEDRPYVFDYHYRTDEPLIAGLGDSGVGLAVTRALVAAHGGRIWVDSEPGIGSTFSVLLPLAGVANGRD